MPSFELVETGLTPDKLVFRRSAHPSVFESAGPDNSVAVEQAPPRRCSLRGKKDVLDCLSVRGLNFVNALVDISGGHPVDVRFLDIHPYQVAVEGWRHPDATLIHYHLVCETSKRAHVRSGDRRQPLNAGDLYRVVHGNEPTIFHGGEAGSLNLIVTLKRPQASIRQASEQPSQVMAAKLDPSTQAMRWGAAF